MQDDLFFQNYLVIFLDHLGQRESLRQITGLPSNVEEKNKFIVLMRETFGRVTLTRGAFKKFFDNFKNSRVNIDSIDPDLRKKFAALGKSEAYFYGMSDSIIIAVPLMSSDENCTAINGVYAAFMATCDIGLITLSAKIAIRGGLDVGVAIRLEGNEIYGPGLERACYIESQLAEYPRFVVGDELLRYLSFVENQQPVSFCGQHAKKIARMCFKMLVRDADGHYMLDYLGDESKETLGRSIDSKVIRDAFHFIKSQHEHFLKQNNHKLSSRYYRLLNYFNSRLSLWGIEI